MKWWDASKASWVTVSKMVVMVLTSLKLKAPTYHAKVPASISVVGL